MSPETVTHRAVHRYDLYDDTKAEVWVDPDNKVNTKADGSYSLTVKHSGTFQIFANYTPTDPSKRGGYKQSAPQTVKTTSTTHNQNIPLKYGYTTTFTLRAYLYPSGLSGTGTMSSGVTMRIEVEGREAANGKTDDSLLPQYIAKVDHAGIVSLIASHPGYKTRRRDRITVKEPDHSYDFSLAP